MEMARVRIAYSGGQGLAKYWTTNNHEHGESYQDNHNCSKQKE